MTKVKRIQYYDSKYNVFIDTDPSRLTLFMNYLMVLINLVLFLVLLGAPLYLIYYWFIQYG